jgi:hypothetical protein
MRNMNGAMEHYCAVHWKQHIEGDVAFMNAVKAHGAPVRRMPEDKPKKVQRRRVVKKSASASVPSRRVVRKKK